MLTVWFDEALALASSLHRAQYRKGTSIRYISHLLAVTALVIEDGSGEDEAIAALLHDTIEDHSYDYYGDCAGLRQDIGQRFGPSVLAIVNACTDDDCFWKSEWRTQKPAYLEHVRHADLATRRVNEGTEPI